MADRVPVPLRCVKCEEIIYEDQPWGEYGGDYDSDDKPRHDTCWNAEKEAERKGREQHAAYIHGLKQRPFESLTYHEASMLAMYESHSRIINAIVGGEPL